MKVVKRGKKYFITGVPPFVVDGETLAEYGPYDSRHDAEDDKRGVQVTLDALERSEAKKQKSVT